MNKKIVGSQKLHEQFTQMQATEAKPNFIFGIKQQKKESARSLPKIQKPPSGQRSNHSTRRQNMMHFHLFNNNMFNNKTQNLKYATSYKQNMFKKQEVVKSMIFLRRMGEKLREEQ